MADYHLGEIESIFADIIWSNAPLTLSLIHILNYGGYPASACISVNSTVIHGIPGHYTLKEGDIVSVDVGAFYKGFHGDCAATYPCGATVSYTHLDVYKRQLPSPLD